MLKTINARMTELSSLFAEMNKADNLNGKIRDLMGGLTVDETTAPEAFILYRESSDRMFKKEIFNLIHDEKIIIKYNPIVALGLYLPYAPLISPNGQVQVVVNATSYCTEQDGKLKINLTDLVGLCQGAYAVYMSLIKYSTICSNFSMRKIIIDTHLQILLKGLSGNSVFSAAQNVKYLHYICARFLMTRHFGLEKDIHETAMNIAKIQQDNEKAFINEMILKTPKEYWNSFQGVIQLLQDNFISLKGKVSPESIRQKISYILGSPNTFAVDYVPYIIALGSGYYTNYSIYRSKLIKNELQPFCVAICTGILQNL